MLPTDQLKGSDPISFKFLVIDHLPGRKGERDRRKKYKACDKLHGAIFPFIVYSPCLTSLPSSLLSTDLSFPLSWKQLRRDVRLQCRCFEMGLR